MVCLKNCQQIVLKLLSRVMDQGFCVIGLFADLGTDLLIEELRREVSFK